VNKPDAFTESIAEVSVAHASVAAEIHAVSQAAYTLEAKQIGCADFPPLRESLAQLQQSPDRFLGFQQSGRIVALLSFACSADALAITRLVVDPAFQRQGIATALLADLERRFPLASRWTVSTAARNQPAVQLYQRLGFTTAHATTSAEGIRLLHLTKARIWNVGKKTS
jgi:ribosomal protein S18 acetylase RimI-like enzyme